MNDYEYEVHGAPVVYTTRPPEPYNPLNRPEVKFTKPVITLIAFIIFNILLGFLNGYLKGKIDIPTSEYTAAAVIVWLLADLIFLLLIAKRAIIWLVHVYQHYASDEIRLKCVFEPSCSEYMILAINKYGLFRGVAKGINRLMRCRPPNGGIDYP